MSKRCLGDDVVIKNERKNDNVLEDTCSLLVPYNDVGDVVSHALLSARRVGINLLLLLDHHIKILYNAYFSKTTSYLCLHPSHHAFDKPKEQSKTSL